MLAAWALKAVAAVIGVTMLWSAGGQRADPQKPRPIGRFFVGYALAVIGLLCPMGAS